VQVWQMPERTLLRSLPYANSVEGAAFSPDGQSLAVASSRAISRQTGPNGWAGTIIEGEVHLWALEAGL
jgi:hypothetical protein